MKTKIPIIGEVIPDKKLGNKVIFFSIRCPKCNYEHTKVEPIVIRGRGVCGKCGDKFRYWTEPALRVEEIIVAYQQIRVH